MSKGKKHTVRLTVDGDWNGSRIDRLVRALRPELSFAAVQTLLRKGRIRLNGKKAAGGSRIEGGDIVEIDFAGGRVPETASSPDSDAGETEEKGARRSDSAAERQDATGAHGSIPIPANAAATSGVGHIGKDIDVLYEDEDVLVINKPANIVVQPGNRRDKGSLVELLELYRARGDTRTGTVVEFPYTPVHRLDYPTTGALLVAKTRPAARALSTAFAEGRITKTYLAVVEGAPEPPEGAVTTPLSIDKGARSRARADIAGKEAITRYTLLASLPGGRVLLEVSISTGRTHQIRAHLATIGHPIAGDAAYGERRNGGREPLLLHAWKIGFPHPRLERVIEVTAPPLEGFPLPEGFPPA